MIRFLSVWCGVALLCMVQGCATTGTSPSPQPPAQRAEIAPAPNGRPGTAVASVPKRDANGSSVSSRPVTVDPDETCIIEDEETETAPLPPGGKQPALARALYYCRLAQAHWKRGDLESAIDTLDRAYALVLSVDPGNDADLLQEKEDLRVHDFQAHSRDLLVPPPGRERQAQRDPADDQQARPGRDRLVHHRSGTGFLCRRLPAVRAASGSDRGRPEGGGSAG